MSGGVTAIIPTWNRSDLLLKALASLREQTLLPDEVIVVDNGSTDDTAAVAARWDARVLSLGRNLGFSAAVNAGIEACQTPWLAIVNNDVTLDPFWLERLVTAARNVQAWFAGCKLLMAGDRRRIDGGFDLLSRGACAWRAGHGEADGPLWSMSQTISFVPFTAALFRRELFEELGLLDVRFESYLEDIEFGLRCATNNRTGIYVPDALAYHEGSATLGRWHGDTVRRIARNQLWIVAKHYPKGWVRQFGWPVLVGQLLWAGVAFGHGAGGACLLGKWQGLRTFREIRRNSEFREHGNQVARVLADSEQHLRHLQQQTSFARYWRWYFRLT